MTNEEPVDAEVVDDYPTAVMHEQVSNSTVALPVSSDFNDWSEEEKALADAAGLVQRKKNQPATIAPRAVIAAFLHQCRRTGLDPIARQIYCIERAGKWQTQISIDGFRLIAERTGEYAGQTAIQWTGDGREWFDVWLFPEPPRAARIGVYRRGFVEPLWAVARWDSYAPMVKDWKTSTEKLSPMWAKMPDLMLGKVAEMLALRRAFPQDLAGLYGTEEMDQASTSPSPQATATRQAVTTETQRKSDKADEIWSQWKSLIDGASTAADIDRVTQQAQGIHALPVPGDESGMTVLDYIRARAAQVVSPDEPEAHVNEETGEVTDKGNLADFKKAQEKVQKENQAARGRLQKGLNSDEPEGGDKK